jgi:hypothetical protein
MTTQVKGCGSTSVPFESSSSCDTLPLYQEQAVNGGFSNRAYKGRGAKERYGSKGAKMSSHNDSFVSSGNSPTHSDSKIPPDFLVENHGSIFLLIPQTNSARIWAADSIGRDSGFQPYWPTVVVEHRYIADIVAGIQSDGLTVQL